jgi:hypothetical protein
MTATATAPEPAPDLAPDPTLRGKAGEEIRFSASAWSRWQSCQRAWWYERYHGLRAPSTPATELGTRLHAAIEHRIKHGGWGLIKGYTPDDDQPPIDARDREVLSDLEAITVRGATIPHGRLITQLTKLARASVDPILEVEVSGHVGELPFVGYVDVLLRDRRTILDWKTSKDPKKWGKTAEELKVNDQLALYAWAALPHGEPVTVAHGQVQTVPALESVLRRSNHAVGTSRIHHGSGAS